MPVLFWTPVISHLRWFSFCNSGSHLLSHIVSNIVSSAAQVLTIVFGMRTGVSPERIATGKFWALSEVLSSLVRKLFFAACCNRTSSVSVSWLFSFHKEVRFTKFDLRSRLISLSSFELTLQPAMSSSPSRIRFASSRWSFAHPMKVSLHPCFGEPAPLALLQDPSDVLLYRFANLI